MTEIGKESLYHIVTTFKGKNGTSVKDLETVLKLRLEKCNSENNKDFAACYTELLAKLPKDLENNAEAFCREYEKSKELPF